METFYRDWLNFLGYFLTRQKQTTNGKPSAVACSNTLEKAVLFFECYVQLHL